MWRPTDNAKQRWDLLVMICALFNCFTVPFKVAFMPPVMDGAYFITLNLLIDLVFALDILTNFRTSFIDEKGDEIFDAWEIAREYFQIVFWVDLIATLPLDYLLSALFSKDPLYELFGLLKIGRLMKLQKIIQYLNVVDEVKQSLNLVKLIFFLIIYIHLYACIWWMLIRDDQVWVLPKFRITEEMYDDLYQDTIQSKYVHSLYVAVQLLSGTD